jgi:hypothetical protein
MGTVTGGGGGHPSTGGSGMRAVSSATPPSVAETIAPNCATTALMRVMARRFHARAPGVVEQERNQGPSLNV